MYPKLDYIFIVFTLFIAEFRISCFFSIIVIVVFTLFYKPYYKVNLFFSVHMK